MSGLYSATAADEERWRVNWVPVDRRRLGMDRSTLLPAAVVLLLLAVTVWILPAIDDAVTVADPIRAGDVIELGGGVQFVPIPGANLVSGVRQGRPGAAGYPGAAVVTYAGVTFRISADTYHGTVAQLLEQIKKNNQDSGPDGGVVRISGDPAAVTTETGQRGLSAHFDGASTSGLLAAFVFGQTGVEIDIVSPQSVAASASTDVAAMISSVRPIKGS